MLPFVQRGERSRFALEARAPLDVSSKDRRQNLDRDVASELRVGRLIDVSHTARTEMTGDFVMRDLCSDHVSGFYAPDLSRGMGQT